MRLKASDIATLVKGRLQGDPDLAVTGAAGLDEAAAGDVTFLRNANDSESQAALSRTRAGAVIVPRGTVCNGRTSIEVDNPIAAFSLVLGLIAEEAAVRPAGIHPTAVVSPDARIGKNVGIGACAVIEKGAVIEDGACLHAHVYVGARSRVGRNTVLHPNVVLREDVSVGQNCILHPGAVIGADGYGFFFSNGRHNKIPQVGTVVIEDDVEVGANSCVDRAMTGATVIGRGTKIDNLVQVAHNVRVGPMCLLVAQVGIGGSTKLGAGVVLAGQVGVADHVTIGDGVQVGAQSGVSSDIPPGGKYWGVPAQPIQDELRKTALLRRLPELAKDLKKLKEIFQKNA